MTECLLIKNAKGEYKIIEKKSELSNSRQVWYKHAKNCSDCKDRIDKTIDKAGGRDPFVVRKMHYLHSRVLDEKTAFFTLTFICGSRCSYSVRIATSPIYVNEKKTRRKVRVGCEGETIVHERLYPVSARNKLKNTDRKNTLNKAKKVRNSIFPKGIAFNIPNVKLYGLCGVKEEHYSWILSNCPEYIKDYIKLSTKEKKEYKGRVVYYFSFPRQRRNELYYLVNWLDKLINKLTEK